METPDLDPARSAHALYADIEAYIVEATRLMDEGKFVGLDELGVSVDALCNRILNLRADETQQFVLRLEDMRGRIDVLQAAMGLMKNKISDEISVSTKRQKAARAYRPPEEKK